MRQQGRLDSMAVAAPRLKPATLLLLVAALALPASASSADSAASADPARIVPWHTIGNAGLGMSKDRVEYNYGARVNADDQHFTTYQVAGGTLRIGFDIHYRVEFLTTNSPRYRTPGGIGVGVRVPLGACRRTAAGNCQFWWRGFRYRGKGLWVRANQNRGGRALFVGLQTTNGRISEVQIFFIPDGSE